jgi:catechol 2,3-dioxygenase-like lactoylglutathione lyase family enzyme
MHTVNEIRYVAYGVPDLDSERAFYRDKWGLREVQADEDTAYFAAEGSDELYVVRLRKSPVKRVDVIGLAAISQEAVDELFCRVKAANCQIIFAPQALRSLGGGYGFRFFSPDGLSFERLPVAPRYRRRLVTSCSTPRNTKRRPNSSSMSSVFA